VDHPVIDLNGDSKSELVNDWSTFGDLTKQKARDFSLRAFFVPENVVPKVRVELTQGHPYRFLSLLPCVLIGFSSPVNPANRAWLY
jgi:hypothetical protein